MSMSIRDIELACREGRTVDFRRHPLQARPPEHSRLFYPFGFPVQVHSDSEEVFDIYQSLWGTFTALFPTQPIICEVYLDMGTEHACPPAPSCRIQRNMLITTADKDNFAFVDIESGFTSITLSQAALRHREYAGYFLLSSPLSALATQCATPVHAACVSHEGVGLLLCGDSGAGKSTLAYSCLRGGWQYTSDDTTLLIRGREPRMVSGNCYQVRFRPESASLFPEINGLTVTPRAAGKPSVEMTTLGDRRFRLAPIARIDYIIFLNRTSAGEASLHDYDSAVARAYMQQALYGTPVQWGRHMAALDQLLEAPVLELRYNDLSWALDRLEQLTKESIHDCAAAVG